MKKILIVLIMAFLLLALPRNASADCKNKGLFGCGSYSSCGDGNTCCATSGECAQYPASTPMSTPVDKGERDNGTVGSTQLLCNNGGAGIQTAIGCIPVLGGQEAFTNFILSWAIGIGGGIAFLLIVYAGFMIMTSSGNPERLKAGQELLTAAISGLILLIFSVFILNFIGVKILKIPGLQ